MQWSITRGGNKSIIASRKFYDNDTIKAVLEMRLDYEKVLEPFMSQLTDNTGGMIQDDNGNVTENKDPVLVKKTISKETSDIIKDYMLGVVEEGTGASAAVEGYAVGGKTGTAEKLPRGNGKYLVSFIGYAPQENPEVVVYVVIDEANSGYATQLASQIMTDIFPYLGIEKKTDSASNTDTQTTQTAQQ